MSSELPPSKKDIARMASRLRRKAEWDPNRVLAARKSPSEKLREMAVETRTEKEYDAADACENCRAERRELGDETALCETHLNAMLF